MAANRDSDTSLWLHNKLGTSSEWASGSICAQLNKEVLRNIKDCFVDLQTQVKLKLLLSFFHIPRRLVEEWKTELEEVIEVAALDSELWVSMIAETIKTFPSTGSLNLEISDYDETRPIFTDMVNDLRRYVHKHSDLGMLPMECQYLNKMALTSVVGQQPPSTKHFTLKRKPKSASLRAELLQKSSDAQSLKKSSAPIIPLRSRGMPRKMTDTTPLRGIPSRVPTSGFRTPTTPTTPARPNMSRTPAGKVFRKDGGIKILDIADQPLGYAAAKKRKRQQELEEQQKRALEAQSSPPVKLEEVPVTTTPDYAVGLSSSVYTQPQTPAPSAVKETTASTTVSSVVATQSQYTANDFIKVETTAIASATSLIQNQTQAVSSNSPQMIQSNIANNNHLMFSIKNDDADESIAIATSIASPHEITKKLKATKKEKGLTTSKASTKPPALVTISSTTNLPSLASLSNTSGIQTQQADGISQQIGATKIVQIKAAPTMRTSVQNIPPLISTQQPTILNIQSNRMNAQTLSLQSNATTPTSISYITANQSNLNQINQWRTNQTEDNKPTIANTTFQNVQEQQSQYSPVVMSQNVKGKTIILANANNPQQKTIILRSVGADGNTILQQVPITGLQNITQQQQQMQQPQQQQIPALVPTSYVITSDNSPQIITNLQQTQNQPGTRLLLTNNANNQVILPQGLTLIQRPGQIMKTIQPQQTQQQPQQIQLQPQPAQPTQLRIQQQPQIVQMQQITRQPKRTVTIGQPQTGAVIGQADIMQQHEQQNQPQQRTIIAAKEIKQPVQTMNVATQRKGLTLSNEHVAKLNEIFSQANRVTRRDKALILGFMGGCRENPMPTPENYIVIKLGETEENVKQADGSILPMVVESLIKLDYNTGEWKKLQHLRHIDQSTDTKKLTTQNSVVI